MGFEYSSRLLLVGIFSHGDDLFNHDVFDQILVPGCQDVSEGYDTPEPLQLVDHIDVGYGLHIRCIFPDPAQRLGYVQR